MPEKTLTVATYAAGASLAAITLIYVFAPTYFLDDDASASSGGFFTSGSRKKGVVGLSNPANDCFINSVLQALAGLGDLRVYLIREMHRRSLDEAWVYTRAVPPAHSGANANMPAWKLEGLQSGIVTKGLKDILDSLNERPIYKKTITAVPFVKTLEVAFRQRISRQQQDAQEFLQVVAERLCDEYHAGRKARNFARRKRLQASTGGSSEQLDDKLVDRKLAILAAHAQGIMSANSDGPDATPERDLPLDERGGEDDEDDGEEGFPMEGKFESQIECLTCGFKPRPTASTFCTLTLNVPQTSSTSLSACFDGMFKTEYIDDFKCEKCRLLHAISVLESEASASTSASFKAKATEDSARLQAAVEKDPEHPPEDIVLPDLRRAPKRRIARHIRLTDFPKVMAVHLSRSIYDASHLSQKNSAKVSFPEQLPLGGLLNQRRYKLLALVTHKGSHHSGHYESFRRQNVQAPYPNINTFQPSGVYSRTASPASTPQMASTPRSTSPPTPTRRLAPTSAPRDREGETSSLRSVAASARTTLTKLASRPSSRAGSRSGTPAGDSPPLPSSVAVVGPPGEVKAGLAAKPRKRRHHERWWRISDEKVKEASTRDVLGMQREVYLLFYELERHTMP
ncbi:cysteine proteinase [Thozetella sp. PMI_491]|nr:cysteine proteinase [Thozetella sp. PMI_491]